MKIAKLFYNNDLFDKFRDYFYGIDIDYRRSILCITITSLIAYGFQLTHVIMSPDMYNEIVTGHNYPINYSGRWFMAFIRNYLLNDHRIVPTFNLLLSIALFIISSLLVAKIWRIKRPLHVFLIVTIIVANTYTCHILRWENAHIEASLTTFIAVLALYLSGERMFFASLFLMTCAHGGYQTGISFSCAAFLAGIALWIVQDGDTKNLAYYLKNKILPGLLVFLIGFITNKIVLYFLLKAGGLKEGSRLATTHIPNSIGELVNNIYFAIHAMPSLFSYQILYFNTTITFLYKIFFALFSISLIVYFFRKPGINRLFVCSLFVILSFLCLLSTFLPTIIIGYTYTSNRILFPFGIFLSLIILFCVMNKSLILKNTSTICAFTLILLYSWHNNMYAYRASIQDRADFELASRIISRIEELPEYDEHINKPLKLVLIGTKDIAVAGYRFTSWPEEKIRREGAFRQWWSAMGIFSYLHFQHERTMQDFLDVNLISQKAADTIFNMQEWPSHKSVSIVDNLVIVMFDKSKTPNSVKKMIFAECAAENELLISGGSTRIKPIHHISEYNPDGSLIATGNDPITRLSIPKPQKNHLYILQLIMESPAQTAAQIFYKLQNKESYSETRSMRCMVNRGLNECYFVIDGNLSNGELRLDPGWVPGKYTIKSIVVRETCERKSL